VFLSKITVFIFTYVNTSKEKLNVFKLIKNKSMSIQTTNPATNKVLKSFDEMTDEQVEAAIEKSNTFSQTWKTSYDDRAKYCIK
jgi:acyl-CoA reductase-like NAD-dependent aldehyde dehydrogenase